MDWKDMHIGIDLGLQELDSNLFGKIQGRAKDYYLNRVTVDLVLGDTTNSIGTGNIPVITPDELRKKYTLLSPYITSLTLGLVREDRYDYGVIPSNFTDNITSGSIWQDIQYIVINPGSPVVDLTSVGGVAVPVANSIFTCDTTNITPELEEGTTYIIYMTIGNRYRIVDPGLLDFTTAGADNNMIGTEFVATKASLSTSTSAGELKPLTVEPDWSTGLVLKAYSANLDMLMYYGATCNIDVGYAFSSGSIRKGITYRVATGGTISDLTSFGASYNTVEANYLFTCTADGTPTWGDSGVVLTETRNFGATLVDFKELDVNLNFAFGTSQDNPLCVLYGSQFRVYHDNKFRINRVNLEYIKTPIKIDSILNINSDLNIAFHGELVDRTIQRIAGHRGQQQYQTIRNENEKLE